MSRRNQVLAMILALVAAPLVGGTSRAGTTPRSVLRVESDRSGKISLVANGAQITQALDAVAENAQLEVLIYGGPAARAPLNLVVPMGPVEDLLHAMLRGRNYALIYDADSAELSRVILLPPSTPGRASSPSPPHRAARGKAQAKAPAPIVIRN